MADEVYTCTCCNSQTFFVMNNKIRCSNCGMERTIYYNKPQHSLKFAMNSKLKKENIRNS